MERLCTSIRLFVLQHVSSHPKRLSVLRLGLISAGYIKHCRTNLFTIRNTANPREAPIYASYKIKGKGKVLLRTGHEGPEGTRRIALLFLQPWI